MSQPGSTTEPVLAPGHLSLQGQPWLSAQELTLRPWRQNDAPDLTRAYTDPEIHRWHARSMTTAEAASWIQYEADRWNQDRGGSWAITRDDALVGRVGIGGVSLEEARAGVTYWVLPEARRQGVASRSLMAVTRWALDDAAFHRLELDHSTHNVTSCRVATKAGFLPEGTKRAQALHLDGWHDMHAHALLASDQRLDERGA